MSRPQGSLRRLLTCAGFALLLIAASLVIAACGGSSSSSESTEASGTEASEAGSALVEEAKATVAELEKPPPFKAPGPPIENVSSVKGKRLFWIANGLEVPFNTELLEAVEEAAGEVGLKVEVGDAGGSAATAAKLMDQAVGQKVDIIIDEAQMVEQMSAPLKAAKEAGIPVIMGYQGDPEPVTAAQEEAGMVAGVTECYSCGGRAMANFVVADSGGEANVILFSVPEQATANIEQEGFEEELEKLCSECQVEVVALPITQWENGQSVTSSALKKNPDANYLVPMYDGVETFMEPGILTSPNAANIKVVSLNASLAQMEKLAAGETVAAEVGFSLKQTGYAFVDQALRVLTETEPSSNSNIELRLFTANNIGEIDVSKDESTWYEPPNVTPKFQELWGIGG